MRVWSTRDTQPPGGIREWGHLVLIVALALTVIFLVLLQIYHLYLFRGSVDYSKVGDIATWVTGLATFGAVVVALRESYRSGMRERSERDRTATSVIPWLEIGGGSWLIRVDNRTGLVVEAWSLELTETSLHICWRDAGPIPPGEVTFSLERITNLPPLRSSNFPSHEFTFIDQYERVWVRDVTGRLTRSSLTVSDFRSHTCTVGSATEG